jgi:hypothetical protein
MKLSTTTHVSVDGVMQGLGAPVVIGQGTRLFRATARTQHLQLVGSQSTPKGITIQVYRPTGRPQYATATADRST